MQLLEAAGPGELRQPSADGAPSTRRAPSQLPDKGARDISALRRSNRRARVALRHADQAAGPQLAPTRSSLLHPNPEVTT